MNTLRKKLTAIGLAGTVGLGAIATSSMPVVAAPIAPSQNTVKQSAPSQSDQVRYRRGNWVVPAIALGIIGAAAAHQYHRRHYHYDPYYGPRYRAYYAPRYHYAPGPYYYGW